MSTIDHLRARHEASDEGFTLIELLIAIVVVGILTAVAIVGIGSLVDSGEDAACDASRDAADPSCQRLLRPVMVLDH